VTGARFDLGPRGRFHQNPLAPSIDRINPRGGYTVDNVRLVLWWINQARGQLDDRDFRACVGVAAEALFKVKLDI
jgi:hypothetical protein